MIKTPLTVIVTTPAGTQLFKLTIANDRLEISIDETSLGSSPEERLNISVNELPVTVAPNSVAVLTAYLSLSDGPDISVSN